MRVPVGSRQNDHRLFCREIWAGKAAPLVSYKRLAVPSARVAQAMRLYKVSYLNNGMKVTNTGLVLMLSNSASNEEKAQSIAMQSSGGRPWTWGPSTHGEPDGERV
jgi:hypothetical protein